MLALGQIARPFLQLTTVATLGVLGGGTGCAVGCTLIGCDSGLKLVTSPAPGGPYRVELLVENGNRYVWRCESSNCSYAFFANYLKSSATVEVIVGADTTRREFTGIRYQKLQPNGSKCDPTCYQGSVTVSPGP